MCVCGFVCFVLFSGKNGERVLKQTLIGLSFDDRAVQGGDFCRLCGITLMEIVGQLEMEE